MQISNDILFLNKTLLSVLDVFIPSYRFTVEENRSVKEFFLLLNHMKGAALPLLPKMEHLVIKRQSLLTQGSVILIHLIK